MAARILRSRGLYQLQIHAQKLHACCPPHPPSPSCYLGVQPSIGPAILCSPESNAILVSRNAKQRPRVGVGNKFVYVVRDCVVVLSLSKERISSLLSEASRHRRAGRGLWLVEPWVGVLFWSSLARLLACERFRGSCFAHTCPQGGRGPFGGRLASGGLAACLVRLLRPCPNLAGQIRSCLGGSSSRLSCLAGWVRRLDSLPLPFSS